MDRFVPNEHAEKRIDLTFAGTVVRLYEVALVSLGHHTRLSRSGETSVLLE